MPALSFTQRDIEQDRARVESRLESFRSITPDSATPLLVVGQTDNSDGNTTPSKMDSAPPDVAQPGVARIDAADFCLESLRDSMQQHGCLLVRGLFPREEAMQLHGVIDQVLQSCELSAAGNTPEQKTHFAPPKNLASIMPRKERELGNTRSFHRESGSAMCIEAPSVAEELLRWYEQRDLKNLLAGYFGEAPCLSAKKWVLRRSKLPVAEAGWHQDGAFMGTDINSLNMWLPLSTCGGSSGAPGLDLLPKRLFSIASADGAQFDWSVSKAQVEQEAGQAELASPEFAPGDALFFDHFFLHRTQFGPQFSKVRYAIETWFFGSSVFPKNQIPLAW